MIASLLIAVAFAAPPPDYRREYPLPDLTAPSGWGVNIHFTDPVPGEIDKLAKSGFKWIRMDFVWSRIESRRGRYDFAPYDRLMAALKGAGVRPVFIFDYGNDLYEKGSPRSDSSRRAFCRFVAAATQHFGGQGVVWEMWNEPNISFWQPKPNAGEYIELARAVGQTIRRTAPQEWIIGPGSSTFDWPFLRACFDAGLLEYWDAVSVHPYRGSEPETASEDWRRLRSMIDAKAPQGKSVAMFSSEWGYSDISSGIGIERQADFVARQYLSNLMAGAPLSIVYDWKNDGTSPTDGESHFGTQFEDLRPKPAYLEVQSLSHALAGYAYRCRLAQDSDADYVLAFQRGRSVQYVAWTTSREPRPVMLHLGADSVAKTLTERPDVWEAADPTLVQASGPLPDTFEVRDPARTRAFVTRVVDSVDVSRLRADRVILRTNGVEEPVIPANRGQAIRKIADAIDGDWSEAPRTLDISVVSSSGQSFTRAVRCIQANPVTVDFVATARSVWAVVHNPGGRRLSVAAEPAGRAPGKPFSASRPGDETILLGERHGAPFTLLVYPAGSARPAVRLTDVAPVAFGEFSPQLLTQDGDPKIQATLTAKSVTAGDGPLQGSEAVQIDYTFPAGWKFLEFHPAADLSMPLQEGAKLNMFVKGDASGDVLRMRFTDSTGQTFQPTFGKIDWQGWRFVSYKLDGQDAGHWGGPDDGVVRYPIRINTVVLIDSAGNAGKPREISVAEIAVVPRT